MPSAPELPYDTAPLGRSENFLLGILGVIVVLVFLESLMAFWVKGYFFFADLPELTDSFRSCKDSFVPGYFGNSFIIAFAGYCLYYGLVALGALYSLFNIRTYLRDFDGSLKQIGQGLVLGLGILLFPLLFPANAFTSGLVCVLILVGVIFNGGDVVQSLFPFFSDFYEWDYTNCINSTTPEGQQVLEMHKLTTFIYKFETASFYFLGIGFCLFLVVFAVVNTASEPRET